MTAHSVVVVGTGDGALIEIIRSCVPKFRAEAHCSTGSCTRALDGMVDGEDKTLAEVR